MCQNKFWFFTKLFFLKKINKLIIFPIQLVINISRSVFVCERPAGRCRVCSVRQYRNWQWCCHSIEERIQPHQMSPFYTHKTQSWRRRENQKQQIWWKEHAKNQRWYGKLLDPLFSIDWPCFLSLSSVNPSPDTWVTVTSPHFPLPPPSSSPLLSDSWYVLLFERFISYMHS